MAREAPTAPAAKIFPVYDLRLNRQNQSNLPIALLLDPIAYQLQLKKLLHHNHGLYKG